MQEEELKKKIETDQEIAAIGFIWASLSCFDSPTRERILGFVSDKHRCEKSRRSTLDFFEFMSRLEKSIPDTKTQE